MSGMFLLFSNLLGLIIALRHKCLVTGHAAQLCHHAPGSGGPAAGAGGCQGKAATGEKEE